MLRIYADEFIDLTPSADKVDVSKLMLTNGTVGPHVALAGATIVETDFHTVTLTLTEAQRSATIAMSGTPGGDGVAVELNIEDGAFLDIAQNAVGQQLSLAVNETEDRNSPKVSHDVTAPSLPRHSPAHLFPKVMGVALDYNGGILRVDASQTVDVTSVRWLSFSRTTTLYCI